MKYFFLPLLVAILLTVTAPSAVSRPVAGDTVYIFTGSAALKPRTISDSLLEHFRNDTDFDYSKEQQQGLSLSELFYRWLRDILSSKSVDRAWGVGKYILIAAAIIAMIFLFSKTGMRSLFTRSPGAILSVEGWVENIHEINFSTEINKAVASSNFTRAVRLLYLQTLKHLADAELIIWRPEKTNRDYEWEIKKIAPQLSVEFISITNIFDYVCYGKYTVTRQKYTQISAEFDQFIINFHVVKNIDIQHQISSRQEPSE